MKENERKWKKEWKKKKIKENEKKDWKKKKINEKEKKNKRKKRKEGPKGCSHRDGPKNWFFYLKLSSEIVEKLRPRKRSDFEHPTKKKKKKEERKWKKMKET